MTRETILTDDELRGYLLTMIETQAGGNVSAWANERRIYATRIHEFIAGTAPTTALLILMGVTSKTVYVGQTK